MFDITKQKYAIDNNMILKRFLNITGFAAGQTKIKRNYPPHDTEGLWYSCKWRLSPWMAPGCKQAFPLEGVPQALADSYN